MSQPKDVYTFSDLQNWESATQGLDRPARLAVIGDPIAHSKSPQMHEPALQTAGIDAAYIRLHLKEDELEEGLSLMRESGFIGANVTIPHKGGAFRLADERTQVAERIGAVNTILFEGDRMIGHNTDAPGLKRAIREQLSMDLGDLRVMIIGAGGGAGKAASVQCAMDHCERLVLVNRTVEKAEALSEELASFFIEPDRLAGPADRLVAIPWEEEAVERELGQVDLVINATSVGMKQSDRAVLSPHLIEPHHLIYDMIYAPPRTRLINDAEAAGARAVNGLSMLLWQGALAFEYWFSREAPVAAMEEGLREAMG